MRHGTEKEFRINNLEDLTGYSFRSFTDVANDELLVRLAGALPVHIEKGFVPRYVFAVIERSESQQVGFVTLRAALTMQLLMRGGHIGYGIDEEYRGHNYAAKAIMMLKPFMREVLHGRVLITCDSDNIASRIHTPVHE